MTTDEGQHIMANDDNLLEDLEATDADSVLGAGCGPDEHLDRELDRRRSKVTAKVGRPGAVDRAGSKARQALGVDRPQDPSLTPEA